MRVNSLSELPKHVRDQVKAQESDKDVATDKQVIWIDQLPPGLNGSDGLINMHWTEYRKVQKKWVQYIFAEQPESHIGQVNLKYVRKSVKVMDWDNMASSFKVVGDALIKNDVIEDDSPKVIKNFSMDWEKADSYREQGVRIEISNVKE